MMGRRGFWLVSDRDPESGETNLTVGPGALAVGIAATVFCVVFLRRRRLHRA